MAWLDTIVMIVPLVLVGVVALLLIRTILQSHKRPALQEPKPQQARVDPAVPIRRDPPQMASLTQEKDKQPTSDHTLFGQAGREVVDTPKPSRPPASPDSFLSDLNSKRTAQFISFINFKGGVGKSTCAVELATALASQHGKRVLLMDLDPQTNATLFLMDYNEWEHWQQNAGSLKTLFDAYLSGNGDQFDISRIVKRNLLSAEGESLVPNLHIVPSHLALVLVDLQLAAKAAVGEAVFSNQAVIRQALQQVQDQYDYVIFDCPPNFNLVTQNGLFASDSYIIPAIPDYLSTLGISLIQGEVSDFSERISTALSMFGGAFTGPQLRGVIFTRVRLRSKKPLRFIDLHERRIHEVHRTNPDLAFKSFLSEGVRYAEAPERHIPVSVSPRKEEREAKTEIFKLTEEFLARFEQPTMQQDSQARVASVETQSGAGQHLPVEGDSSVPEGTEERMPLAKAS